MRHVFIIGSKGIPSAYGGYETFVDKLTEYHQNHPDIKYHVACKSSEAGEFTYHNARCFKIKVPPVGSVQAIYYDITALRHCIKYIKKNNIRNTIVYILTCRIGPFMAYFQNKIHQLGGKIYLNPDGHEWMRAKWSIPVRKYWKISEKMMVKNSDLIICDSKNIESYILSSYGQYHPKTSFIAYGAEIRSSLIGDDSNELLKWYDDKHLSAQSYYLIVGRFVPENNFEIMIREFMNTDTNMDLAIITTENNKLLIDLEDKLHFKNDTRIKFVGTVYDQELLKKIRENAFAYIHGHEVGGTNPSLLEALSSTKINLLLNIGFNKEVGEDGAIYWNKDKGDLAKAIVLANHMNNNEINSLSMKAKTRIKDAYSWEIISKQYEDEFI